MFTTYPDENKRRVNKVNVVRKYFECRARELPSTKILPLEQDRVSLTRSDYCLALYRFFPAISASSVLTERMASSIVGSMPQLRISRLPFCWIT